MSETSLSIFFPVVAVGSRILGIEVRIDVAECPGEKRVIKTVIEKLLSKCLFCREEVH